MELSVEGEERAEKNDQSGSRRFWQPRLGNVQQREVGGTRRRSKEISVERTPWSRCVGRDIIVAVRKER